MHFTESCFVVKPGKRGRLLKENAVPTVSCISQLTETKISPKGPLKQMLPPKVQEKIETDFPYNRTECSTSQKVKQLTNKVKALQQKVHR